MIRLTRPTLLGYFATEEEAIEALTGLSVRGIPGTWEQARTSEVFEFGGQFALHFAVHVEAADLGRAREYVAERSRRK